MPDRGRTIVFGERALSKARFRVGILDVLAFHAIAREHGEVDTAANRARINHSKLGPRASSLRLEVCRIRLNPRLYHALCAARMSAETRLCCTQTDTRVGVPSAGADEQCIYILTLSTIISDFLFARRILLSLIC